MIARVAARALKGGVRLPARAAKIVLFPPARIGVVRWIASHIRIPIPAAGILRVRCLDAAWVRAPKRSHIAIVISRHRVILPNADGAYNYYYDYNQGGRVAGNQLQIVSGGSVIFNLQATYTWDNEGRMTNMTYPSGTSLNYTYDPVSRLTQIASASSGIVSVTAAYNGESQLSTLNYGGYGPLVNSGSYGTTTFTEALVGGRALRG